MLADQIRRAAEAAPRVKLPEVAAVLWRAYGAGHVSEEQAEELSALIEARKALPAAQKPVLVRRGSRPRTEASMERRRRWAASGRLPPAIAARFTLAETAVLAVVADEVAQRGDCRLTIDHIAALAGVSRSTVKNAIRQARELGLVTVEERQQTAWRNLSNVVRIVSPEWQAWGRLARRSPRLGGGVKSVTTTNTDRGRPATTRPGEPSQGLPGRQSSGNRRGLLDPGRLAEEA